MSDLGWRASHGIERSLTRSDEGYFVPNPTANRQDLPEDLAANHDHYLHGLAKR